jgi:hypothetical protein
MVVKLRSCLCKNNGKMEFKKEALRKHMDLRKMR